MKNSFKYTVAGHTFCISLPDGFGEEVLLPYAPFREMDEDVDPIIDLRVELVESLRDKVDGEVQDMFNDEPPYFWLYRNGLSENPFDMPCSQWIFGFSYSQHHPDCILYTSEDYSQAVVYVAGRNAEKMVEFALSNSMMLLYTFRTTPHETLLVHASVIAYEGKGYMFLGRSGTGKSTHSSLWLKHIEGTELLNDDNPVIRIVDGKAVIFGSPWSGKTPCYKNLQLPLGGFVKLSQAPYNKITRLSAIHAYAALLPSCSCMRWEPAATTALHNTVEKVISSVAAWGLECLPDEDAALTCHNAIVVK